MGHQFFLLVNYIRVVKVSCSNDGMGSQAHHGSECLCVLAVLHEPAGGFGTEPDARAEDEGWNES
jgi:hypothetical protein